MASAIAAGLGLAAIGFAGRYVMRRAPNLAKKMQDLAAELPKLDEAVSSRYYKGGFETKMSRREAALILGISPTANKLKVKDSFKRVMGFNHPDRGGSPYLASKINEAKNLLESNR